MANGGSESETLAWLVQFVLYQSPHAELTPLPSLPYPAQAP